MRLTLMGAGYGIDISIVMAMDNCTYMANARKRIGLLGNYSKDEYLKEILFFIHAIFYAA
jgi:hypothetical protein